MHIFEIFKNNPVMGISVCTCLGTILWCLMLLKRNRGHKLDRFLIALLGAMAVYQALRVLKDSGLIGVQYNHTFDAGVNFILSSLCCVAVLILKLSCAARKSTQVHLRLVEANEKPLNISVGVTPADLPAAVLEAAPIAMFTVDEHGRVNSWNGAAERLLGWRKEEVLGMSPPLTIPAEGYAGATTRFRAKRGEPVDASVWSVPFQAGSSVRGQLTLLMQIPAPQHPNMMLAGTGR